MKSIIKALLPKRFRQHVRRLLSKNDNEDYVSQALGRVRCGDFEIQVPQSHLLLRLLKEQPYRDLCIGITAQFMSGKYPAGTMIDIGANVGDTAAIIATYAPNKLILIEGSDYFYDLLVQNAKKFPNETDIRKVLVSDGQSTAGRFCHWGGTAFFQADPTGSAERKTERLADIVDESTCLIKTDTDGFDYQILMDSLECLARLSPAVIFENQVRSERDLATANELFFELMRVGYSCYLVWDDAGFHLVSTESIQILKDLNRYLYKVFQRDGHKSIYNYDVLALHEQDRDIYEKMCNWYRSY